MVSLRSGKRTTRRSGEGNAIEQTPKSTPKRPRIKVEKQPTNDAEIDETEQISTDVVEEIEKNEKKSEVTPIPINSYKEQSEEEDVDDEGDTLEESDDDMPVEVTSKKPPSENNAIDVAPATLPEKSVFEQLMAKKAKEAKKKSSKNKDKRLKKNHKKIARKTAEGVYQVNLNKSKTSFKVVTLKRGVQKMLEPELNYREELLRSRTANSRLSNTASFQQRSKWISKRN